MTEENEVLTEEADIEKVSYNKKDLLKTLKAMQKEGSVGAEEIKMMRKELGFTQSSFTKSTQDKAKRKAKNKTARKARKLNRGR